MHVHTLEKLHATGRPVPTPFMFMASVTRLSHLLTLFGQFLGKLGNFLFHQLVTLFMAE